MSRSEIKKEKYDYDDILNFGKFKNTKITGDFLKKNYEYFMWLRDEEIIKLGFFLNRDLDDLIEQNEPSWYGLSEWDIN